MNIRKEELSEEQVYKTKALQELEIAQTFQITSKEY